MRHIAILFAIALGACDRAEPVSTETKGPWKIETLFDFDGCRAYWADASGYHGFYFVRCGSSVRTEWSEPRTNGKQHWTENYEVPSVAQ